MTDETALLAAVLDRPEDDTPRLVYADWLDDHDRPERAAFIRVQCDAASGKPFEIMRLWELLHHSAEWFPDVCRAFRFDTRNWGVMSDGSIHYESKHTDGEFFVCRGFVDELRVPTLGVLFGGPCGRCGGRGGEDRYPADDPANRLMHGSHWYACPDCNDGRTPGIAAAVWAAHPVARVVVAEPQPRQAWVVVGAREADPASGLTPAAWRWGYENRPDWPVELRRAMRGGGYWWKTEAEALAALSDACVRLGRERAATAVGSTA